MSTRKKKTKIRKQARCRHEFAILEEGDAEVGAVCSDTCSKCGYTLTMDEQQDMAMCEGIFSEAYNSQLMNA